MSAGSSQAPLRTRSTAAHMPITGLCDTGATLTLGRVDTGRRTREDRCMDAQAARAANVEARRDGHAPRPGGPGTVHGMLSVDELKQEIEAGTIDTVVTAFTDMQGRLIGKRIQGEYFVEDVLAHSIEGCNYLLALDMEMDPVPGYEMANWEGGYGDFKIAPDLATLRRIPWLEGTALVLCDVVSDEDRPIVAAPRRIPIEQYERAQGTGFLPMFASELEFYLYREGYEEAAEK